jgi:hypothetical protein
VSKKTICELPNKAINKLREEIFQQLATEMNKAVLKKVKKEIASLPRKSDKSYTLKYECGCEPPHNSIRSGRRPDGPNPLNAMCMDCLTYYKCVEPVRKGVSSGGGNEQGGK